MKNAHEQISIEWCHTSVQGDSTDIEVILEVAGQAIMGEDELSELDKELRKYSRV